MTLDVNDYTFSKCLLWGVCIRHCQEAHNARKQGFYGRCIKEAALAAATLLPIIGQIVSLIERAFFNNSHQSEPKPLHSRGITNQGNHSQPFLPLPQPNVPNNIVANESETKSNISNIEFIRPENIHDYPQIKHWMVTHVGPYKPVGYAEPDTEQMVQREYFKRHPDPNTRPFGQKRTQECEQIQKELQKELWNEVEKTKFDNKVINWAVGPLSYNEEAVFELLKLNIDLIEEATKENAGTQKANELFTLDEVNKITSAIQQNDKAGCSLIFIQKLHNNFALRALVMAAFGNEPRSGEVVFKDDKVFINDGKYQILLPKKGVAEVLKLKNRFPQHSWHTIRNFLAHFHRNTKLNGFCETAALLEDTIPQKKIVFGFHNNQLIALSSSNFNE